MIDEPVNLTFHTPVRGSMLVVEDVEPCRRLLLALLHSRGYDAQGVGSAEEALELLQRSGDGRPCWIVVDVDLPGISGLELVKQVSKSCPDIRAMFVTGADGKKIRRFCDHHRHPVDYFPKPLDVPLFLDHIHRLQQQLH